MAIESDPDVKDALISIIDGPEDRRIGNIFLGLLRLALGWTFLWGALDKMFGLGFDTCRTEEGSIDTMCDAAFFAGGSPTWGYLNFGTQGSKTSGLFTWLATDNPGDIGLVDFLYLGALLIAGVTFLLGIAMRLGAFAGGGLMVSIYLAGSVGPEFNPFMNENLIYAIAMVALVGLGAGRHLGLGETWARQPFVQANPMLR